jgi:hypothetical protein
MYLEVSVHFIKSILVLFITLSSWAVLAQEDSSDRSDILAQNKAFSKLSLMVILIS